MDVLDPFFGLALRSLVVLFPLSVGWLAFRRLALSKSGNAWLYAAMCIFSVTVAAGTMPWALGLTSLNWFFVVLSFLCPALWIGVIALCDISRINRYDQKPFLTIVRSVAETSSVPLLLKNPQLPSEPKPVFRHKTTTPEVKEVKNAGMSPSAKNILSLARDIRGNANSDKRRPKLLPSPASTSLSFLPKSSDV